MFCEINQEFLDNVADENIKQLIIALLNTVESQNQTIKEQGGGPKSGYEPH